MMDIVKSNEIFLVNRKNEYDSNYLFIDAIGEKVSAGDTVKFMKKGDTFSTIGTVSDLYYLAISCFKMFSQKWEYYVIDVV